MAKKILFFEPGLSAVGSSVLRSQQLRLLRILNEMGAECFFFGADRPENVNIEQINKLKEEFNLSECCVVPVTSHGTNWRTARKATRNSTKILERELQRISPDISFSRGLDVALALEKLGRAKTGQTLFMCRGASSAEVSLKGYRTSSLRAQYISMREHKVFNSVDRIVSASDTMRSWIRGIVPNAIVDVLPCCFDEDRFKFMPKERFRIRAKLGWNNDVPVIIYSGGASYWQRLPEIVELLRKIQKIMPNLHVIFLSSASEEILQLSRAAGLIESQLDVRTVAHSEVSSWLNAANAGIILRHDNLVNQVASPIKVGEYIACGVPVITSSCVGDYSERIGRANAGLILEEPVNVDTIVSFLKDRENLEQCAQNAIKLSHEFSWLSAKKVISESFDL